MSASVRLSVTMFAHVLFAGVASSQVATSTYAYGDFDNKGFDIINVGNLNVHFSIPVINKPGRGLPFTYNLSYDTSVWYPVSVNGSMVWTPVQNFGWRGDTEVATGYMTFSSVTFNAGSGGTGKSGQCPETDDSNFVYHDTFGVAHPFPQIATQRRVGGSCGNSVSGGSEIATDGSGYTVNVSNFTTSTITAANGKAIAVPNVNNGASTAKDANGNEISVDGSGNFTDTLGDVVLKVAGSAPSPHTFTYTNPQGGTSSYTMNYTTYTVATNFGVGGITEYGATSTPLVSSITLPDGGSYQFSYEPTPGSCTPLTGTFSQNCVSGRLASVTLPTGGTISYSYVGGNNGIESDGSTAGLNRTDSTGAEWQYSRTLNSGTPGQGSTWTTQVIDPNQNHTVATFSQDSTVSAIRNLYPTQIQVYQGGVSTSNLLQTKIQCYNASFSNCAGASVSSPFTQVDTYTQLPNGNTRLSEIVYNAYGLVADDKEYGYGVALGAAPNNAKLIQETATTFFAVTSSGIASELQSVVVSDWSSGGQVTLSATGYTYDGAATTATSGTPQHVSTSGGNGNLTQISSGGLTTNFTYYDTGTPNTSTAPNGAVATYVYGSGSCGNSFPTSVNEPLSLSRSITWNCTGGVPTQITDENGNSTTTSYADPNYWRPTQAGDQEGNATNISYFGVNAIESSLAGFNGGHSTSDVRTTFDGFGRPVFSQTLQQANGSTYDTTEIDYNNVGQSFRSTLPYSAGASPSSSNTTAPATTETFDALGRVLSITAGDGGKTTISYTNNDALVTVSGSQAFRKQVEYDGLGRLVSVCEITSAQGSGACGQGVAQTGFLTKYTYDALGHLLTVAQNAQSGSAQSRTYAYDGLGRLTSEKNPETGTTTYFWDNGPSACFSHSFPGNLVATENNAGVFTCYGYDARNRAFGYNATNTNNCRGFIYDSSTAVPAGVTIQNGKGRMIGAYTNSACNGRNTLVVDEWFSYSPRGEITDIYESTPHSNGYYHISQSYWPNGAVASLSGVPGTPTLNYGGGGAGLDGEGRYTQVTASSGTSPLASMSYSTSSTNSVLGGLTNITFGSGDAENFGYDPNTGRMTGFQSVVNGVPDSGTLTWNTNGSLAQMAISDSISGRSDSETCNYGYDDLSRLASVGCGAAWGQTFSYDAFGNISKSVPSGSTGVTFNPTYSGNNQFSSIPGVMVSYDANGNLLTDNFNTHTWDAYGDLTSVNTGSSTSTPTYDALGRMVETNFGTNFNVFVYGPSGQRLALASGSNLLVSFMPLPAGTQAVYGSTGLKHYTHADWEGTERLASTPARTVSSTTEYAPFGETYGATGDDSYTGQLQTTVSSLLDFPARRYGPTQGRWISPDLLGVGAVDITNPQSWNRYAYVLNNPLTMIDPLGLLECFTIGGDTWGITAGGTTTSGTDPSETFCWGDGSGGGGGGQAGGGGGNGNAPNSGQQKSPARQQCEANAANSHNSNMQTAKQNILPNVVGGALIGVAVTPLAACVVGAVVGVEGGPPAMALGCGIGFTIAANPVALAWEAGIGAVGGLVRSGVQAGSAALTYHQQMAACANIP